MIFKTRARRTNIFARIFSFLFIFFFFDTALIHFVRLDSFEHLNSLYLFRSKVVSSLCIIPVDELEPASNERGTEILVLKVVCVFPNIARQNRYSAVHDLDSVLVTGGVNTKLATGLVVCQPSPAASFHRRRLRRELALKVLETAKVGINFLGQTTAGQRRIVSSVWLHVPPEDGMVQVRATVEQNSASQCVQSSIVAISLSSLEFWVSSVEVLDVASVVLGKMSFHDVSAQMRVELVPARFKVVNLGQVTELLVIPNATFGLYQVERFLNERVLLSDGGSRRLRDSDTVDKLTACGNIGTFVGQILVLVLSDLVETNSREFRDLFLEGFDVAGHFGRQLKADGSGSVL